jgi:mono/diheme cytochrome c family protein
MKLGYKLCLVLLVSMVAALFLASGCASNKAAVSEGGTAPRPEVSGDLKTAQAVFEKKCSACHSLDRPLSVQQSESDWRLTVERMQLKVFSGISDEDVEMIVKYLAATRNL